MESKVETREEIITGLKYVKTQIENIILETQKQVEISSLISPLTVFGLPPFSHS